jgi:tRNA nucleotidyltransferase (CCA-adding enzyme)
MSDEFDAVTECVRERVTPDAEEQARLQDVTERLVERVEQATADLSVETETILVGSTARGTWVAGDRDVDMFVSFPPALDREELERYGLEIGNEVLPDGQEEYAEHPYVVGEFEGFTVDLVPCFAVEDATQIQSAVDRTPFHTRYLESRLDDDLAGEVRLAKQFLKGIGAYGSDLRTRGFSGYLTELLLCEYGSFRAFVDAAAEWTPPVRFDPEGHGTEEFDDPLVVIDPTDPARNVAAALSPENVARVQHYARELLDEPQEALFEPSAPAPLSPADVRAELEQRGTDPVAIRLPAPDIVEDQLYPQLEKSLAGVIDAVEREGFAVLRGDAFADDHVVILLELTVSTLPSVERHDGPPVHVRTHADGFYSKYEVSDAYGPYLDGNRYVVERERAFESAVEFLRSEKISEIALGARIERQLESGYEVLEGDAVAELTQEFGVELARYFDPDV